MTVLGPGWNGAHRALILSRRAVARNVGELNDRIEQSEKTLDELRGLREAARLELQQIQDAIAASDYEPPKGFDKWGNLIPGNGVSS